VTASRRVTRTPLWGDGSPSVVLFFLALNPIGRSTMKKRTGQSQHMMYNDNLLKQDLLKV
jgi:hypothetical protein